MRSVRALAPLGVLVGSLVAAQILGLIGTDQWVPWSVVAKSLVVGVPDALFCIGIVLVYRAFRIINFAAIGFGVLAVAEYLLFRAVWEWNFWLVLPIILVGGVLLGALLDVGVFRRFEHAPRLVLTVATIAVGQLLSGAALQSSRLFGLNTDDPPPPIVPSTPVTDVHVTWFPEVFDGEHFLALGVGLVVFAALAIFLRRSAVGVAIRGASENRDRAATLGVNTSALSIVVWMIVAFLGVTAALLQAWMQDTSLSLALGAAGSSAIGATALLRALTAAVVARMERLDLAVGAALALSVIDTAVFWSFRQSAIVDAVLLAIIVVALFVQRRGIGRADAAVGGTWEAAEELRSIPRPLADLPVVKRGTRRAAGVAILVVLAFPWLMSPSQTLRGSVFAIYGVIGISIVVLTGWGGQISLGQFGFVAVGGIVGGWLTTSVGLPFPLALIAGAAAGAGAAIVVGLPALRIQGLFLAVTSLGFAVVAQSVLLNERYLGFIPSRITRPKLFGLDMNTDERSFYYLCVVLLLVAVFAAVGLRRTRTGRVLIAMRDNERAAQAFGVSLVRTRLGTFAISGALAAGAGVLFANHQFALRQTAFGAEQSVQMFLMAIIGGLGSVWGVLLGAVYFGVVTILIGGLAGQLLAGAGGVLLVLLVLPGGLGALVYRLRDTWLRRIALRYRIFVPSLLAVDRRDAESGLVPLAPRLDEDEPVERQYTVDSVIATTGASQQLRTWQG